jgi:hypothetical protein
MGIINPTLISKDWETTYFEEVPDSMIGRSRLKTL